MKADISATLYDKRLASKAGSVPDHAHVRGVVDEILQPVKHSAACGRSPAMNPTLNA